MVKKVPYGKKAPVYKKHHHIQVYLDFVTYPYRFQKLLLLLLGKKRFLFAGFYGTDAPREFTVVHMKMEC